VLFRELCHCAARAQSIVDLVFLRRGLHDNADTLREQVQEMIDETDPERCQAVALGYGLCSNGLAGLRARTLPLVVPRAHDCVTLLLGSKEAYHRLFSERPGTYYYSGGWVEREADSVPRRPQDGAGLDLPFEELVAKYGRENAEYLREFQSNWVERYTHSTFIDTGLGDREAYRNYAKQVAADHGWSFDEIAGDMRLLQDLVDGRWDDDRFLVVPPGHRIAPTSAADILAAAP